MMADDDSDPDWEEAPEEYEEHRKNLQRTNLQNFWSPINKRILERIGK